MKNKNRKPKKLTLGGMVETTKGLLCDAVAVDGYDVRRRGKGSTTYYGDKTEDTAINNKTPELSLGVDAFYIPFIYYSKCGTIYETKSRDIYVSLRIRIWFPRKFKKNDQGK